MSSNTMFWVWFCIFLWSNYQLLSKFYDLILFSTCLRSSSSHCQVMDLFNPLTTNVPQHIETSQLICNADQLTGFFMMVDIGW